MAIEVTDRVIYRHELAQLLHVTNECVRRYIKAGKLPKPDVAMSPQITGWKTSTLRAAGVNVV